MIKYIKSHLVQSQRQLSLQSHSQRLLQIIRLHYQLQDQIDLIAVDLYLDLFHFYFHLLQRGKDFPSLYRLQKYCCISFSQI